MGGGWGWLGNGDGDGRLIKFLSLGIGWGNWIEKWVDVHFMRFESCAMFWELGSGRRRCGGASAF